MGGPPPIAKLSFLQITAGSALVYATKIHFKKNAHTPLHNLRLFCHNDSANANHCYNLTSSERGPPFSGG